MNFPGDDNQRVLSRASEVNDPLVMDVVRIETLPYSNVYDYASKNGAPVAKYRPPERTCTANGKPETSRLSANETVPFSAQLKLVHEGMEIFLGAYPIQLLPSVVSTESDTGGKCSAVAIAEGSTAKMGPFEQGLLENKPRKTANTLQDKRSVELACGIGVKPPKNPRHSLYHSTPNENKKHGNDTSARTVPFMKRKLFGISPTASIQSSIKPERKNTSLPNELGYLQGPLRLKPSAKSNSRPREANFSFVLKLSLNARPTMYNVVCPEVINFHPRLDEVCENHLDTLNMENRSDCSHNLVLRPIHLDTACSSSVNKYKVVQSARVVTTRSGRVSKPPAILTNKPLATLTNKPLVMVPPNKLIYAQQPGDRDVEVENITQELPEMAPVRGRRKARIPANFRCGTCRKTYLGRRMRRHLLAFPTHVPLDRLQQNESESASTPGRSVANWSPSAATVPSPIAPALSDSVLYRKLLQVVMEREPDEQCSFFLGALSQFVGLLRAKVPYLITPGGQEGDLVGYVDQNVADCLQLNCGNYCFRTDTFRQEYEKLLRNVGNGIADNQAVEQVTNPDSPEDEPDVPAESSFDEFLENIVALEVQRGLLLPLPLPMAIEEEEGPKDAQLEAAPVPAPVVFCEPVALSNQGTTAFGRPCQLSEDLFPSQSQEVLQAFEELTNLSELCSPQVLGMSGGTSTIESSTALNFY